MIRFIVVVILLAAACGDRAAPPSPLQAPREVSKAGVAAAANDPRVVCPAGATQRQDEGFGVRMVWCVDKDQRHHGPMRKWWRNGRLAAEMNYVHGLLEGAHRGWSEDGKPETERHYRAGKLHGKALGWHPNGRKALESEWRDGELVGVARRWDENGRPERVTK